MKLSRFGVLLCVFTACGLITSCLAPDQFDPTGRAPIGNLVSIKDAGGAVKVSGWARDPETNKPIPVKIGVNGKIDTFMADRVRSGPHNGHGFLYEFPLNAGVYDVCVWVPNTVGIGADRLLGCHNEFKVSSANPVAKITTATSTEPGEVDVSGYAYDRDVLSSTTVAIKVDEEFSAQTIASDSYSSTVTTPAGKTKKIAFETTLQLPPGARRVCITALNQGRGSNKSGGCKNIEVKEEPVDSRPIGAITTVTPYGTNNLNVAGLASDPDGDAGLQVTVAISDTSSQATKAVNVIDGSFSADFLNLGDGVYTVCATASDVGGGSGTTGDKDLECGSAVLGETDIGTAPASEISPVAPKSTSPINGAQRDAGVSVQLTDGSTMWFFGDTHDVDSLGQVEYFVNNTAAWASGEAPLVTRDASSKGKPFQFVEPPAGMCSDSQYDDAALWPESAVVIPQGNGDDRILVFMSKVCLGDGWLEIDGRGMAVVETTYDPSDPPISKRIRGTVTTSGFSSKAEPLGRASVSASDGRIYGYHCEQFVPSDPGAERNCFVARAEAESAEDPSGWKYWNGGIEDEPGSWGPDQNAAPLELGLGMYGESLPVAAFTIVYDASIEMFVMSYSPWPGFTDRIEIRVASSPTGPWSSPATATLPGCVESHNGVGHYCYAGTPQPSISGDGMLGVGYFDQLVSTIPNRGQYLGAHVPFRVSR